MEIHEPSQRTRCEARVCNNMESRRCKVRVSICNMTVRADRKKHELQKKLLAKKRAKLEAMVAKHKEQQARLAEEKKK